MSARYLLCPGEVRSRTDGTWHHVGAAQLAALYGVSMAGCLVLPFADRRRRDELLDRADSGEFIALKPRYDGDYRLPEARS